MNTIRKLILGALVCMVVAAGVVFVIYKKVQTSKSDAPRPLQQFHYVAVTRNVAAGERVSDDMLTTVTWTSTLPIDGALQSPDQAVGRLTSYPLAAGMILTRQILAPPNSSIGLSQKIPSGMRGIAFKTDDVSDFGGFLFPGAHVDVLVTTGPGAGKEGAGDKTVLLLENIDVLATGKEIVADPSSKPKEETVVTLLVTPEDARKVALAQQRGVIHLVLRNSSDDSTTGEKATSYAEIAGIKSAADAHAVLARVPTFTAEPKLQHVEVVLGTKTYQQQYRNNVPAGDLAPLPDSSPAQAPGFGGRKP